jgi:hypothetical protein
MDVAFETKPKESQTIKPNPGLLTKTLHPKPQTLDPEPSTPDLKR